MHTYLSHQPKMTSHPILLSAPHGGRLFPVGFCDDSPLNETQLLATSDFGTDELVSMRDDLSYLKALYARTIVDLNRSSTQLDPRLIDGAPATNDPYVAAGYGVIPRFAAQNYQIRNRRISLAAAQNILTRYYVPFHSKLRSSIDFLRNEHGFVLVLDIHTAPARVMKGADIVLGSLGGVSIAKNLTARMRGIFENYFSQVVLDDPFSGGFIAKEYGQPRKNVHVLQVEISREHIECKNRELSQEFFNIWALVLEDIVNEMDATLAGHVAAE